MARAENTELIDTFEQFYRRYYSDEVGELAQNYPGEQRSLFVDWADLYRFDPELADDFISQPEQYREYAEEALRLYDLPVDVSLGQAHVRVRNLDRTTDIRAIRARHVNTLVGVQGIVRKATDVRPKIQEAAFECQRCGTLTYIPQSSGDFQEPHECQGCERQGPFQINFDQSEFVDSQKLRVQESPEGLRGGETPQAIDVHIEDDITGNVTPGDHVTVTGILHLEQQGSDQDKSAVFDVYMDGMSVTIEDEEFEEMDITDEDKTEIVELSNEPDIYDKMVASMAPAIYGYDEEKLAMILQLFSGVTKHLPDESRIRGDLHMLLIGDPGTGKCLEGSTKVTLADGTQKPIREIVESHLNNPTSIDDGVYQEVDIPLPSMDDDGTLVQKRATKVWKREAPEEMYRIETASGTELEVTPSHPLFVYSDGAFEAVQAEGLREGDPIAVHDSDPVTVTDGGVASTADVRQPPTSPLGSKVRQSKITSIEPVEPDYDWVYDLEVEGTHNYLSNNVVSHNSQMISYVQNIAPRSVYTSGKGSSSAGLTAAAVQDDFGEGQQWTLEAGALVLADRGIAAVDELDKMRCVTGDTLVHLADGRVSRIRDLARDAAAEGEIEELPNGRTIRDVDLDAWTMTEDGRLVERPVTAVHEYDAPEELTTVRTESGEELTATHDHPFFAFENGERVEKPARDLTAGDWVYVPRRLSRPATDGGTAALPATAVEPDDAASTVGGAMGAVLGYLSGDGNVYYDRDAGVYGIRFTNKEEQLLADFERACQAAFDATPVRPPSEQRDDGVETVRLPGREYADAVLDAGMNLETYDDKAFPEGVTDASPATKAAFVRALADSEGSVDVATGNVKIHSSSDELLLGVKSLLLEFGVSTQIQTKGRDDKRDVYVLAITAADSLDAFEQHVGFTLDRKQSALEAVCEAASGDRTILDVIPDCGGLLSDLRDSLRLQQSECGIGDATYCNFENGDADVSLRLARVVLDTFEERKATADSTLEALAERRDWDTLAEVKGRYHVSQRELADGTEYTQQGISRAWGDSDGLRTVVADRLREVVESVAETDLEPLRSLVRGDVKWRRVDAVETTAAEASGDRTRLLRGELADVLGCSPENGVEMGRQLLAVDPSTSSWDALRAELDRHGVSFAALARELDVVPSTVSRWFNGVVETDRFSEVESVALDRIRTVRKEVKRLVDAIERSEEPKVYDLTVAGTHNFVANGMVVHNSEDRSAMHEALEQQKISISKAGINATLKSRCSLLGAANPKYGRFDQYEPIGEQIDLEPALISRFDLIFTVTDQPDEEEDRRLAEHILQTNYAGQLNTQRTEMSAPNVSQEEVENETGEVAPAIDPDLLRKYIAYAKRNCFPTMTEAAKETIEDFYVDLRAKGVDEDAPVPVTARQLEALVRLSEASARVRLSDEVAVEDAERAVDITRSCLQDIGVDPETGQFDADVVETGTSKSQRDRIKNLKQLIAEIEDEYEEGAPVEEVMARADEIGMEQSKADHEIDKLKQKGEVYEPSTDHLRTT
ncbi:LAGLIDADG family homing endonuclease [Halorussus halobius]|uniref:LAGLIDADG family homing endonuclease n=1 Tax=Halorussus halobius TaxID=1710537 RepID=UPI001091D5ED|nr:LAGLIDADG family homing endonuclease [Halorussus halobius]